MLSSEQKTSKGDAIREGDAILLEALRAAGWSAADENDRDRVTAYLTEHGYDIVPDRVIDWLSV